MRIKKSDIIFAIIMLIFIMSFIEIKYFSYKSEPILMNYSKNKIINIINSIINESINNKIYSNNYDKIILVEKDNYGSIVSLDFNNELINNMLYIVTDDILCNIKLLEKANYDEMNLKYLSNEDKVYYVPYGIIYNNSILNNIGPKIPYRIHMIGSTNNDTKINIEEYGINSSKVEVVLNINFDMQVLLPFSSNNFNVSKSIILDSKIIQGKVPNYYGGIFSTN